MLVDAGEGVYLALRECGFDVTDLDLVLITHKHGDHFLGLPTLAMHARRADVRLRVLGPSDLDLPSLFAAVGIPHYLEVLEPTLIEPPATSKLVFEGNGVKVYGVAADHTVPSLAYRVEADGLAVAFSGDTRPCRFIVELARGCKLLVHEAGGGLASEWLAHAHGHSTLRDAVRVAVEAGVGYLMPFHFYSDPIALECGGVKLILPAPRVPVDVARLP